MVGDPILYPYVKTQIVNTSNIIKAGYQPMRTFTVF